MKKLLFIILMITVLCSCATSKKTKSVTNVELETQRKKDSIATLTITSLNKKIEQLGSEKIKLETSLKEKKMEESTTATEIKLKAEIDPITGKYKPSEYLETNNGVITKSVSITGNGEVVVKSNATNSKEIEMAQNQIFEKEYQQKFTLAETNFKKQLEVKVSEIEKLKSEIKSKEKEVKTSGSSFWWGFKLGILSIILLLIILWFANKKFNFYHIIKNSNT